MLEIIMSNYHRINNIFLIRIRMANPLLDQYSREAEFYISQSKNLFFIL